MSRRLSPLATSNICSSPSLSINVTCSLQSATISFRTNQRYHLGKLSAYSSPGFGGVKWPCELLGEAENRRFDFTKSEQFL